MRALGRCLAVLIAAAAAGSPARIAAAATETSAFFDYVYAEPNSGAASGGHVAVVFGDAAFHFQHADPGLIRSVKEPAAAFAYAYRGLGNRSLRVSRVRVSEDSLARLSAAFERRHLVQESQLDLLEGRRRDRAFIEYLAARSDPQDEREMDWSATGIRLAGAGYFFCGPESAERASRYEGVRRRIEDRYGPDFLVRRAADLAREIEALDPRAFADDAADPLAADALPAAPLLFADRYRELLQAWLAVDVLRGGRGLCPDALRTSAAPPFALSDGEIEALRRRARAASERLVALLDSRRPDWGYPLLIAVARSIALEHSIETRRLVVLDTFSERAEKLSTDEVRPLVSVLEAVRRERREDFASARAAILTGQGESAWSRLETAANLLLEIDGALDAGRALRGQDQLLPARAAPWREGWPIPVAGRDRIRRALARAHLRERDLEGRLRDLYGYDLVSRNCVTEIFDTIDGALGARDGGAAAREESRRRLGGYVGGRSGLNFIPRLSLRSVDRSYRVVARLGQPSYRRLRLRELEQPGADSLLVTLRESNTLTSTVYRPHLDDGVFLFFTDGAVLARPLLGSLNLLAAAASGLAGVPASPFDRGRLLLAGLRGALFSLPELAFVNIRKGSLPVLPARWLESGAK